MQEKVWKIISTAFIGPMCYGKTPPLDTSKCDFPDTFIAAYLLLRFANDERATAWDKQIMNEKTFGAHVHVFEVLELTARHAAESFLGPDCSRVSLYHTFPEKSYCVSFHERKKVCASARSSGRNADNGTRKNSLDGFVEIKSGNIVRWLWNFFKYIIHESTNSKRTVPIGSSTL